MKFWRKPLDLDKCKTQKGEIHVIDDRCKGCGFCIEFCPNEVLKESEKYNVKGYHPPEVDDPDKCIGCKLCELICPDFAIYVLLPEECKEYEAEEAQETKEKSKSNTKKASGEVVENA